MSAIVVGLDLLSFVLKAVVVVVAVVMILSAVVGAMRRQRPERGRLVVRRLNGRYDDLVNSLRAPVLGAKRFRRFTRQEKKAKGKRDDADKKHVYVLDFHGDMNASGVGSLRQEVSAIVGQARPTDEVVLRLESPGGVVHGYGLAASQLMRLREKKLRLTVCVDKIAASGGYMMACVADEVVAAPFAIIGSIGVVAPVPNVNRLLEQHGVDYEEMTAGEFKRTVSVLGKISPEGRRKFQEQLEETHGLFKDFVQQHRPGLDMARVATGEYWFAKRAQELKLVDRLSTSDDYLLGLMPDANVLHLSYREPQAWRQRLTSAVGDAAERAVVRAFWRLDRTPLA